MKYFRIGISVLCALSICLYAIFFIREMRQDKTYPVITIDEEIIDVNQHSHGGKQVYRDQEVIIWSAISSDNKPLIAVFNVSEKEKEITVDLTKYDLAGEYTLRDLWVKKDIEKIIDEITCRVNSHGAKLYKLK